MEDGRPAGETVPVAGRTDGRRRRGRPAQVPERDDGKKVKTTITLNAAAWKRLHHHAVEEGKHPCLVVEELIEQHLRRYRVQDLRAGGGSEGEETLRVA